MKYNYIVMKKKYEYITQFKKIGWLSSWWIALKFFQDEQLITEIPHNQAIKLTIEVLD